MANALEPEHKDLAKALGEDPTEKESKLEVRRPTMLIRRPPTQPPVGMKWAWEPKTLAWILVATGTNI